MGEERQRVRPLGNQGQVLPSVTDSIACHLTSAFKAKGTLVGCGPGCQGYAEDQNVLGWWMKRKKLEGLYPG